VVVHGVVEKWRAFKQWDWEYLDTTYGNDKVVVADCLINPSIGVRTTLAEYVRYILHPEHHALEVLRRERKLATPFYAYGYKPFHDHPELTNDYALPAYAADWCAHLPKELREAVYPHGQDWLLLAPPGARSRTHQDDGATIAWFAQISGRKSFVLYPPEDEPFLYGGAVDPFTSDRSAFPEYAKARPLGHNLYPGELLFLPPNWYHCVVSQTPSMTVTGNIVTHVNFGAYVRFAYRERVPQFLSRMPLLDDIIC
jgi:hypothetical protein